MPPGLRINTALALAEGVPNAIKEIASTLDVQLETTRLTYDLPVDQASWGLFITSRSLARFDVFSTTMCYEISRLKSTLEEVHPGPGELPERMGRQVARASQAAQESMALFDRFKMLYDGYYLYLPVSDREVLDKELPNFTSSYDDLHHSAAGLVRDVVKWDKCFSLVLTEHGREQLIKELDRRRAWTVSTFPEQVQPLLSKVQALAARRKHLLQDSATLWDEHCQDWTSRSGRRLTSGDFCDALGWDLELFRELQMQADEQQAAVCELREFKALASKNCTTLGAIGEAPLPLEQVRRSFRQYTVMYNQAGNIVMRAERFQDAMLVHMDMLNRARESV
ncbi:hypothetical protein C8T65DRAFT_745961 [Cerioporus squamosus]|nr:hypothetical protein C8T65DRAFT_745961 [Cerioporus squamosus]